MDYREIELDRKTYHVTLRRIPAEAFSRILSFFSQPCIFHWGDGGQKPLRFWLMPIFSLVVLPVTLSQPLQWSSLGPQGTIIVKVLLEERLPVENRTGQSRSPVIYAETPSAVLTFGQNGGWRKLTAPLRFEDHEWYAVSTVKGPTAVCVGRGGIFVSRGESAHYTYFTRSFLKDKTTYSFDVSFSDPSVMYTIADISKHGGSDEELLKSTDGGLHWNDVPAMRATDQASSLLDVRIDPQNSNVVYLTIGMDNGTVLMKSKDGGMSWERIQDRARFDFSCITFDPTDPEVIYFLAGIPPHMAVYQSTNGLKSYSLKKHVDHAYQLAIHPKDRHHLYVLALPHQLLESEDGGESWKEINTFAIENKVVLSLAVDSNGTIYLGTAGGGVFVREAKTAANILFEQSFTASKTKGEQ